MKLWLVGAANVGKSTLFNRLLGTYRAIVTDIAGTTRELLRDYSQWQEMKWVEIVDSPGLLDFKEELEFIKQIIAESDILFFVIDGKAWIWAKEQQISEMLIASGKKSKVVLVVNKLEWSLFGGKYEMALADFYALWFEHVIGISAKAGDNIDLLLEIVQSFKKTMTTTDAIKKDDAVAIAIVWKPNSGKSTLMNYLAKEVVSHVSPTPGTTLDYLTTDMKLGKHTFRLYDTAGIRKVARASQLERIAWDKTYKMIDFVKPIVVMMIDMSETISHMDLKIIGEMINHNVPIVVALSKVDLVTNAKEKKQKMDMVIAFMSMAKWIPIITLSWETGEGIQQLFGVIKKIYDQQFRRISTGEINKAISTAFIQGPPRFPKNKICKLYYMTQVDVNPPTFVCFINKLDRQNFAFSKWIDNTLRKNFWLIGVPVSLTFKEKEERFLEKPSSDRYEERDREEELHDDEE
jgi:GTPase